MTDRELLEKAAKAAGFQWNSTVQHEDGSLHGCFLDADYQEAWPWNPLIDDSDALRLAVKLGIDLDCGSDHIVAYIWDFAARDASVRGIEEPFGGDKLAAYRRAIVRAAAALAGD